MCGGGTVGEVTVEGVAGKSVELLAEFSMRFSAKSLLPYGICWQELNRLFFLSKNRNSLTCAHTLCIK